MQIETNVPIPPHNKGPGPPFKYPFLHMEIGDSFEVDGDIFPSVRAAASAYGKTHGIKFITRKNGNLLRVWRVE